MTTSTSDKERLRDTLRSLDAYEIPESLQSALVKNRGDNDDGDDTTTTIPKIITGTVATSTLDPSLIQRYKEARDLYLRRQIQSTFLQHVASYNDEDGQVDTPDAPTEEDEQKLDEALAQVRSQVSQAAQGFHQQVLELHQKYNTFCLRREELRKMVQDMDGEQEACSNNKNNSNDSEIRMDVDDDDDADFDDDQLAEEEERLTMLQQKKAQLEAELYRLRQETNILKTKSERTEAQVEQMLQDSEANEGPLSPTALQAEAEETQKKLEKLKEMQSFYDELRGLMEELTGIQIASVKHADGKPNTKDQSAAHDASNEGKMDELQTNNTNILVHVRVFHEHEIQIILRSDSEKPDELRVAAAKFLTSTVLSAPVDECDRSSNDEAADDNPDDGNNTKILKLTIPPLDDLVRLCSMFPPGEELRFLMREAMARIRIVQNRVSELALLYRNVFTRIGSFHHPTDGFGSAEQEVICSLNEGITIVLRLTADCPIVPGSVYIHDMVGIAGWNNELVNNIRERVSASREFQSPWELVQAVQTEVGRFALPKTPTLPFRKKKN